MKHVSESLQFSNPQQVFLNRNFHHFLGTFSVMKSIIHRTMIFVVTIIILVRDNIHFNFGVKLSCTWQILWYLKNFRIIVTFQLSFITTPFFIVEIMSRLRLDHHGKPGSTRRSFRPIVGLLRSAHSRSRLASEIRTQDLPVSSQST